MYCDVVFYYGFLLSFNSSYFARSSHPHCQGLSLGRRTMMAMTLVIWTESTAEKGGSGGTGNAVREIIWEKDARHFVGVQYGRNRCTLWGHACAFEANVSGKPRHSFPDVCPDLPATSSKFSSYHQISSILIPSNTITLNHVVCCVLEHYATLWRIMISLCSISWLAGDKLSTVGVD